ncbi:MAG: N-acetyltransferase [Pseudomonadota bacterium]
MELEFSIGSDGREGDIEALFDTAFSAAEGAEEGAVIRKLVHDLLADTAAPDLLVCAAMQAGALVGCIAFSRLRFGGDPRVVFLLSPVAVRPDLQGQGIGQRLLAFGLAQLKARGVDVAVTYGSPDYYGKVGFAPVSQEVIPPPWPLSQPIGWLAQPLTEQPLEQLAGPATCVSAFDDPAYW